MKPGTFLREVFFYFVTEDFTENKFQMKMSKQSKQKNTKVTFMEHL